MLEATALPAEPQPLPQHQPLISWEQSWAKLQKWSLGAGGQTSPQIFSFSFSIFYWTYYEPKEIFTSTFYKDIAAQFLYREVFPIFFLIGFG